MAHYKNTAPGMRGIITKGGETVWAEPGETVEVADAVKVPDDFEKATTKPADKPV